MVLPLVMAGVAAASAIAGLVAQGMSEAEARRKVEEMQSEVNGIGGFVSPDEDYSQIDYTGDFNPYLNKTPESAQYETVTEDPQTRAIQMEALQNLVSQANGSADATNAAEQFAAMSEAGQMANAREGAIRQGMERKGQGGTGTSAIMRAQAAQMGANRAQGGTMDAAAKAALQKLAAQQGALQGAGAVRGMDYGVARDKASTINDFNRFNVAARNAVAQRNVDMQNSAGMRNANTRQDVAGRNSGVKNANVDRRYNRAKDTRTDELQRATMRANAAGGVASQINHGGQTYGQMGKQGSDLFTNIGSGVAAYEHANPSQPPPAGQYTSDDDSFHSQWW